MNKHKKTLDGWELPLVLHESPKSKHRKSPTVYPLVTPRQRRRKKIDFQSVVKLLLGWVALGVFFFVLPDPVARIVIVGLAILFTISVFL